MASFCKATARVQLKTSSFAGRRVVGRTQPRAVRASRVAIVAAAVRLEPTVPVIDARTTKGTPSGKTDVHQRLAIQSQSPDTLEKVQSIIAEQLGTDVESVGPAAKFVDLGADSLDTVEIMMALEEQFDITLDEEGAEKISTVQEAADMIEDLKSA